MASSRVIRLTSIPATVTPGRIWVAVEESYRYAAYAVPAPRTNSTPRQTPAISQPRLPLRCFALAMLIDPPWLSASTS
jgi:hypothetical protein